MTEAIVCWIIGGICIFLGISNYKGNISSLHRYHRHRVAEENKLPMGKKVGAGTILCGSGVAINGVFSAVVHFTESQVFTTIGVSVMCVCLAVGLGLSVYAIIKYNKGLF